MIINQNWKIQSYHVGEMKDLEVASPDFIDHYWITAKVPGDVHSTLIEKKIIEDPYIGHNDMKCQWIEEKVWWYRTEFQYEKNVAKGERLELTFEGLDTFATIYINGIEIGHTLNMFIAHSFDVTRELCVGKNIIAVKLDPISLHVKEKQKDLWSLFNKERIWTRKAQMNYGWDWGPRLITAGIWKEVHLEKRRAAKLESIFAKTRKIEANQAIIDIEINIEPLIRNIPLEVEVRFSCGDEQIIQTTSIQGRFAHFALHVNQPKLWWTHDLGTPHLYQLEIRLLQNNEVIDQQLKQFGIRTVEVQQIDEQGNSVFTFVLNGVKLFAKGANWIPVDNLIGAAPDSRYTHLINQSREAHMNMLRVWGGGIYEKDIFYDECDRQGLLVWQDFMFACALYPDFNHNFMENVRQEIAQVIKRLRNHASLALWCGNNENDWLYEVFHSSGQITTPYYGEKIYHELMPELLEALDPTRLYWPSSPYGGNDHDAPDQGDTHNWQVWHGNVEPRRFGEALGVNYSVEGISFKNYKRDTSTFISEFGMHASANRYTLQRNIPEGQFYWGSDEMAYRNKDYHHQKGILLMEGYTGIPQNLEEYLNFSMLTQAEGLKYGIEHYRRHKPWTSGALFWQLNDSWPGTSWSCIDYYLIPKASYYYAKRFYHPILLSIDHDPGQDLKIWVVNDQLETYKDSLQLEVYHFEGNLIFSQEIPVAIAANAALQVASFSEKEILKDFPANQVIVRLHSSGEKTLENVYYLRDQKDLELPKANLQVEVDQQQQQVRISTDQLARFVKLELPAEMVTFSDNFFDLLPGTSRMIQIGHLEGKSVQLDDLQILALNGLHY